MHRRVITHYYGPDFDPALLELTRDRHKPACKRIKLMIPISFKCLKCGHLFFLGSKIIMKTETIYESIYHEVHINRFAFDCP